MTHIHKGWTVAFASMVALTVGSTSTYVITQGMFLKPLTEEFHWTQAQYFSGYSIGGLMGALGMPLIGLAADRIGLKRTMLIGILLYAFSYAALAFLNGSYTQYLIIAVIVGLTAQGQSPLLYAKAVSAWIDRNRGLALGLALAGTGIGGFLIPPFANYLLHEYGWRAARLGLSAAILVVALPAVWFFISEPTTERQAQLRAERAEFPGLSLRETLTKRDFWLIAVAIFLSGVAANAIYVSVQPVLTSHGITQDDAVACVSILALSQIAGRFLTGFLLDLFPTPKIGLVLFSSLFASIAILAYADSFALAVIGIILFGIGLGAELELAAFYTGRFFGLKNFGQIYGYIFGGYVISTAFGPVAMGWSFDLYHSYGPAMVGLEMCLVVAAVLVLVIGGYVFKPPAKE